MENSSNTEKSQLPTHHTDFSPVVPELSLLAFFPFLHRPFKEEKGTKSVLCRGKFDAINFIFFFSILHHPRKIVRVEGIGGNRSRQRHGVQFQLESSNSGF